jgi:hypothetical protein
MTHRYCGVNIEYNTCNVISTTSNSNDFNGETFLQTFSIGDSNEQITVIADKYDLEDKLTQNLNKTINKMNEINPSDYKVIIIIVLIGLAGVIYLTNRNI